MKNKSVKGQKFTSRLMISFQVFGCIGLVIYSFLVIESIGCDYNDNLRTNSDFAIQFVAVGISFYGWKYYRLERFIQSTLMAFLPVVSFVISFHNLLNSISYN